MDSAKFGEIYRQFYKPSVAFVKSYVHDRMAAEDIVSDSLISLWQTLRVETVDSPKALLLSILRNNSLNYLKHLNVRDNYAEMYASLSERELGIRIKTLEACDPKEIFSAEIGEIVDKTLKTMPQQTRLIFELSRYRNLSVREIAQKISLSEKSVEYHITKSLKALRLALKDYLR
ncbi:MAG: RNA polymerase sigma-70 factor [Dysgonamonadaceae bacterium]|nr:RNA polymerase sigma-70 factor [Dysgonamonadaceae bacterium]